MKFVCCTKCKYPELSYHKQGKKQLIAKCFACHNEQKIDSEHVAGKAILKDFEEMYKKHPDWLIKKVSQASKSAAAEAQAAGVNVDDD